MACCIAGWTATCVPCATTLPVFCAAATQQLAFADVVGARLLDVDVLAGVQRQQRDRRVPMVGRGDRHGVDGRIVKNAAEVG